MGEGREGEGLKDRLFLTVCVHPVRALLPHDVSMESSPGLYSPHIIGHLCLDQLRYLERTSSQKERRKATVKRTRGNASDEGGDKKCGEGQRYKRGQQNQSGLCGKPGDPGSRMQGFHGALALQRTRGERHQTSEVWPQTTASVFIHCSPRSAHVHTPPTPSTPTPHLSLHPHSSRGCCWFSGIGFSSSESIKNGFEKP